MTSLFFKGSVKGSSRPGTRTKKMKMSGYPDAVRTGIKSLYVQIAAPGGAGGTGRGTTGRRIEVASDLTFPG